MNRDGKETVRREEIAEDIGNVAQRSWQSRVCRRQKESLLYCSCSVLLGSSGTVSVDVVLVDRLDYRIGWHASNVYVDQTVTYKDT